MTGDTLVLHAGDDVAVALRDLPGVPRGHKVAVRDLPSEELAFGEEEFVPWQVGAVM